MSVVLVPAALVTELLDRNRALQEATAAATAEGRATFARLLADRVALRAEIVRLSLTAGRPDTP
jgi:hypothetical protein